MTDIQGWQAPPFLKTLATLRWRDHGLICNDEQWLHFKAKLDALMSKSGRWAVPKQTLGSRINLLMALERDPNTVRNYFGGQNPLPKDYVDIVQGVCLVITHYENLPEPIRTEAIYQLINHLPGVERGKLRSWLGRSWVPILGQRMALPATVDALSELRPELTVWPRQVSQVAPADRAGLVGGSVAERQMQVSLICEQDPVHDTFCAVVIDEVRREPDIDRLTQTVHGLDFGNPAKPVLLLVTVSATGDGSHALGKFLADQMQPVAAVLFMEDDASTELFGIAPEHLVRLPKVEFTPPRKPPPQPTQPLVEPLPTPPLSAQEPSTQVITSAPPKASTPPPHNSDLGPPPLTRDELEPLILLTRSLDPDLAFSRESLAFALGQPFEAVDRLLGRWLRHGVIVPAGRAHDIEVFAVPGAIRRDIAELVQQQPELNRPNQIDFGQMPVRLSAISPVAPPYRGTKLAAQFDVATSPSMSTWSAAIISDAYKLDSLEATRQMLRARQKLLVVDLLPTVATLEHKTRYWRRAFIWAVTSLILGTIAIGLFAALTRATDWGPTFAAVIALGLLVAVVIWTINHQNARAWLRLWGEMGLR